jgi:hypothetical protein
MQAQGLPLLLLLLLILLLLLLLAPQLLRARVGAQTVP